jgi:hypothetical protein
MRALCLAAAVALTGCSVDLRERWYSCDDGVCPNDWFCHADRLCHSRPESTGIDGGLDAGMEGGMDAGTDGAPPPIDTGMDAPPPSDGGLADVKVPGTDAGMPDAGLCPLLPLLDLTDNYEDGLAGGAWGDEISPGVTSPSPVSEMGGELVLRLDAGEGGGATVGRATTAPLMLEGHAVTIRIRDVPTSDVATQFVAEITPTRSVYLEMVGRGIYFYLREGAARIELGSIVYPIAAGDSASRLYWRLEIGRDCIGGSISMDGRTWTPVGMGTSTNDWNKARMVIRMVALLTLGSTHDVFADDFDILP